MIVLWVAAGVLSAAVAGLVLHRAAQAARDVGPADPTVAVYRRQLAEMDDLAARGLLADSDLKEARAEAGRRLLGAAEAKVEPWTATLAQRRGALIVAGLAPVAALALYLTVGAPGARDLPFHKRVEAWKSADLATLTPQEMAALLTQATKEKPDPDGYRYLAIAEDQSGNPAGASRALRKAITLAPQRADLWEMLGLSIVAESQGVESDGAQSAFRQALARDPNSVLSRFHLARARSQAGDQAGAVADLKSLLASLKADDPRRGDLQQAIQEAQAGPATASGAADAAGPGGMIRGMVARLAARLKDNPDDPEGWVRLVRSYAVLGDAQARDSALTEARARYRGREDILTKLDAAARTEPMK